MNKAELCAKVAENGDMTKAEAERTLNSVVDTIKAELARGEKVVITGFGTFETDERAERQGRNPQTGDAITIAACKVIKFKVGKHLKDAVK